MEYDAAESDLESARTSTKDAKLLAQIWFNLGLVEEGREAPAPPMVAFYRSNQFSKSKAAAAKIAGKNIAESSDATGASDEATDDEDARRKLAGDGTLDGSGPWIVQYGEPNHSIHALGRKGKGPLAFEEMGATWQGRCSWADEVKVEKSDGRFVTVSVHRSSSEMVFMCTSSKNELHPCGDDDDEKPADTACLGGEHEYRLYVLERGARILSASWDEKVAEAVTVEPKAGGVIGVQGLECGDVKP